MHAVMTRAADLKSVQCDFPPPFFTGTMEGGRQTEVSKAILGRKDVPYVVAAPLLIQVCLGRMATLLHVVCAG
jgi:hypothetical protein